MKAILLCTFAAATLLMTGLVAQQAAAPGDRSAMMPMGQMMGQMMPMMAAHAKAAKLADQLVNSFAAIENETNAEARNEKLAEHGKLLRELQANLKKQSEMMEHMHGMMMGGAMPAGEHKAQ